MPTRLLTHGSAQDGCRGGSRGWSRPGRWFRLPTCAVWLLLSPLAPPSVSAPILLCHWQVAAEGLWSPPPRPRDRSQDGRSLLPRPSLQDGAGRTGVGGEAVQVPGGKLRGRKHWLGPGRRDTQAKAREATCGASARGEASSPGDSSPWIPRTPGASGCPCHHSVLVAPPPNPQACVHREGVLVSASLVSSRVGTRHDPLSQCPFSTGLSVGSKAAGLEAPVCS